ncbi:L51-S25-CI-B8 domain-containing protein [Aphelenchoides bicaudatus]|nr:L51-S25-CI-B8 domain-containing protein [Aphelenchoides bicaudatus]
MDVPEDNVSLIDVVKSSAKSHLSNDLDKLDGPKLFVWESECMRRLDLLGLYSVFKDHDAKYLFLPDKPELLKDYLEPPDTHTYHIRILTRLPKQLQELIESNEHFKRRRATLLAWPFYWSPTFGDFILNDFTHTGPARLMLTDNYEVLFLSACALNNVFTAHQFYYYGPWAQQSSSETAHVFDQIIVIDRLMDPVTPLLEQFSFSGMLDTLFGIGIKNVIEVPEEVLKETELLANCKEGPVKKIQLESEVYRDLIHLSSENARLEIQRILSELHKIEETQKSISSASDIKRFMPSLTKLVKQKGLASNALGLLFICQCSYAQPSNSAQIRCEQEILAGVFNQSTVVEFIEDLIIDGGQNAIPALRLICLQSLVYNGLTSKTWHEYQKLLVQSFGPNAVAWCLNLQISGLIYVAGSSNNSKFSQLSNELKRMRCVVEQEPLASYYVNYVPLMVRVLEQKLRENWKGFEMQINERLKGQSMAPSQIPKRALFVVGGLTRSEIACIRALKPGFQTSIKMPAIPHVDRIKTIFTAAKGLNFAFRFTGYPTAPQYNGWSGRAIPQLHRLTIRFCKKDHTSAGIREFISKQLVEFSRQNPATAIYVVPVRNVKPVLSGEYANGRQVRVHASNFTFEQTCRYMNDLRSRSGEPIVKFLSAQMPEVKSIQGAWNPLTWQDTKQNAAWPDLPQPEFSTHRSAKLSATEYILLNSRPNDEAQKVEAKS